MRPRFTVAIRLLLAAALVVILGACGGSALQKQAADPIVGMRAAASDTSDTEVLGRWLLGELLVPGGDAARAKAARAKLDKAGGKGLYASLARAIDDEMHGRNRSAALAHLDALTAARTSDNPDAPLVAWFSANHLLSLRSSVTGLWDKARPVVARSLEQPGSIGWRARSDLAEWWSVDGLRGDPGVTGKSFLEVAAQRFGCVKNARIAGPFGHLAPGDHRAHFEAERAGPWPFTFPADPLRLDKPHVLAVERRGCQLRSSEPVASGIFYVETFVELPAAREVIVAVQGVYGLFVDDVEVLTRDSKEWGIWPRFGVRMRLQGGRHRVLARIGGPETAIRILAPDGSPLEVETSDDPAPPYALARPEILPDPNVLQPFLASLGVPAQANAPRSRAHRDTHDPISRYLASWIAHIEGQDDVASVLIEPLVKDPARATGPALSTQAIFSEKDPIFPPSDARDLVKDVRVRAAQKDGELWWPQLWLALDQADKMGAPEVAAKVAQISNRFREVPDIAKALGTMYARIGWTVEHARTVRETAARFPDDTEALYALLRLLDQRGDVGEADRIAKRIAELDPDAEVALERALERRDYGAAIRELSRIGQARKDRRDITAKVADLLTRAGARTESMTALERAVEKDPNDATARLALADAKLSAGDRSALRKALVEAIQTGADTGALREAIELVEGTTELTPYQIDSKKVIAEFEASGVSMPGTAARVLDYAAIWIHADGSARMLEHEIIGIQSQEAIEQHAEQRLPQGLILKLRTIKKDGRILEPEFIADKPTVTMPHLEVGDYIETQTLYTLRGDGRGGRSFEGPRWFFREEKIPYFRSEYVVISPKNRSLDIEVGGAVPAPELKENGAFIVRRFRVDKSPALPEEPASAPTQEFLPNVRVGWGIDLEDTIARMVDAASDETPRDPRLVRIAEQIVTGASGDGEKAPRPKSIDEQARRVYRWVLANVEAGREGDGRRVVTGKSGNRTEAFLYLCRLLGIEASLGMVRDRLTAPPRGRLSEAESFNALAVRLKTEKGVRWMIVRDKFAPYGYLPSSLRGQPAVVLAQKAPRETTPTAGSKDGVTYEGTVELASDGSATLKLEQRFEGKFAIMLRTALETLPDAQREEVIESKLIGQALPGARLRSLEVKNAGDLDAPLVLSMDLEMHDFARVRGGEIVISPPFALRLAPFATLPSRETPLYISEQSSLFSVVKLRVKLPGGSRVTSSLVSSAAKDGVRTATVSDRVEQDTLVFERAINIPAGRVQPDAYAPFQDFVREAETALHRDIVVTVGGR
jgi:tetratricopeptide (TPR) repeat protein